MDVSLEDVKTLRAKTGAGFGDCKKALVEAAGNLTEAERILKEKGLAAAGKRADRATGGGGGIFTALASDKAVIVEIACETDFVALTDQFKALGAQTAASILANGSVNAEMDAEIKNAVAVLKENIVVKHFKVMPVASDESVGVYVHSGLIGSLVRAKISGKDKNDASIQKLLKSVAQHCVAFAPLFLDASKVDAAHLDEQRSIFIEQTKQLGKPQAIAEKIAEGKLKSYLGEVCLVDQPYIDDNKISVGDMVKSVAKETGAGIELTDCVYYKVGLE